VTGSRSGGPSGGGTARHGLVIGKFYPPHAGHHHLIETAAQHCRRLSVVVMAASRELVPLDDRVRWLRAAHRDLPGLEVVGVTDDVRIDYEDPEVWSRHVDLVEAALARMVVTAVRPGEEGPSTDVDRATSATVDLVATSEPYGAELARRLGAAHLLVDQARTAHPVSGTVVRADPVGCWEWLRHPVRAGLARRVAVLGAESTGTTAVSRALAERLRARSGVWSTTGWVPEYGRVYTEERVAVQRAQHAHAGRPGVPVVEDLVWTPEDFTAVARRQQDLEDAAAGAGSPVLVCDTDVFTTCVWHTRYVTAERVGTAAASAIPWSGLPLPPGLRHLAESRRADLYLLTEQDGVPFVQDGLRDGEHLRSWMTEEFRARLTETGRPWVSLTGTLGERVERALRACDDLVSAGRTFAAPLG